MNEEIIKILSSNLNITKKQVESVINLLKEGNTIPFIARYRKEVTGALTEDKIRNIEEMYRYQENLYNRKLDVIRLIDEKGLLNQELKEEILSATKLVEVEDLYLPFKEKKKTKASEAIKNGLQGLSQEILKFVDTPDLIAEKYLNDFVKTKEDAILGASYIIAEEISDNAKFRKYIRENIKKYGVINTKVKKKNPDEKKVYEIYYDYSEKISTIKTSSYFSNKSC